MPSQPDDTRDAVDFDGLLHANIAQVFNERDPHKRLAALRALWSDEPVLYEPHAAFSGAEDISANLSALQARLPAGTTFTPVGTALGHHDGAILKWRASAPGQQAHTTGTDVAFFKAGRIHRLYVFLDPARA